MDRPALPTEIEITPALMEAMVKRGLVIVPISATDAMCDAGEESAWAEDPRAVWDSMIRAATTAPKIRDQ